MADPGRGGALSGRVLLSRRRPRMTVIIGVALVANALLLAWALSIGRQLFINELAGTVFGPASSVFYDTLGAYLERGWQVLGWLGLLLVVVGWFTGSNASGTAVRTTLSGGLESVGAQLADGPLGGAGRWVAANARWLRVAVGVVVRRPAVGQRRLGVTAGLVGAARGRAPGGRADPGRGRPRSGSSSERRRAEHPPCMTHDRPKDASTGRLLLDQLVDSVPGREVVGPGSCCWPSAQRQRTSSRRARLGR